ncbi:c-type cytochrome biogenesis protein CcsB [Actinotalea sp. BY-33]|uniref:C-type cytochrome biogenesis protein CcsB n=1 Tax=Actinotalea soli TaxID=2819234 RepID=A0A939LR23_9CELL|nr:c-type cytochrome biogenesis protein CcsB [Actinotalea soli]MBO1752443.1 c-type cytochrome biogenesis protein CcsB [Actinotalea soli]
MGTGELSTLLAWGAVTAYAIALVAFSIDLARLADGLARPAEALGGRGQAAAAGDTVAAGAGAAGTTTMTPVATPVGTTSADLAGPSGDDGPEAAGGPGRSRRAVGVAMATTTLGLGLHVLAAVLRGIAAGRVPWANMYEFTLVGTLVAVATFLALCRRRDVRFLGSLVVGLVLIALGVGLAAFYVPADAVEPALQSYWLVIHVSIATIATGLLTVSFAASALQLLKDSRDRGSARLSAARWRLLDALPSTRDLEALSFRINAVGFVLWTFTIMAGAVWAEHAWGRYWGWDPKEVWSFVVWVVYAAYLHARTTRGWSGRRAAWFVLVGYATVIFNFTGVNLFFQGLHSYSGL